MGDKQHLQGKLVTHKVEDKDEKFYSEVQEFDSVWTFGSFYALEMNAIPISYRLGELSRLHFGCKSLKLMHSLIIGWC